MRDLQKREIRPAGELLTQETREKQRRRELVLGSLAKHGLLEYDSSGNRIFDVNNFGSLPIGEVGEVGGRKLNTLDLVEILAEQEGISKEKAKNSNARPKVKPLISLPRSLSDMLSQNDGSYLQRASNSLTQPWKLSRTFRLWTSAYKLASGEVTNFAEMAIVQELFGTLKAKRDENGALIIRHPETGQGMIFSAEKFSELTKINPSTRIKRDGHAMAFSFDGNTWDFVTKCMPNLAKAGILKKEDFKIMGGRATAETYSVNTRRTSRTKPFVTLTARPGQTAKYYIGKEDAEIDLLDPETAGVIKTVHGKRVLTATFPLLDEREMEVYNQQALRGLQDRDRDISRGALASYVYVRGPEMQQRRKKYRATDFFPQRADESAETYAQRVAQLNDIEFVRTKVSEMFSSAGVGIHNLSWPEQLQIANAILEEKDANRIIKFAKRFGLEGVRVFSALDYDPNLKNVIFDIADKLPFETAKEIFKNFGALKNQAKNCAVALRDSGIVHSQLLIKGQNKFTFEEQVSEAIIRRGKDMLYTAQALANSGKAETMAFDNRYMSTRESQEVPQALAIYSKNLEKLHDLLSLGKNGSFEYLLLSASEGQIPQIYDFAVKNKRSQTVTYLTIQLREHGASLGQHNLDMEFDGEARINVLFSDMMIGKNISDPTRAQALSFRLDREGKQREGSNIVANDPTQKQGELSLEIGGFAQDKDTSESAIVGRVTSIGNVLASKAERRDGQKKPQYYHNRESFAREFGDAEVFAGIVRQIRGKIKQYYGDGQMG